MKQCCATDGVEASYIRQEVLPHFFKHFWNQRVGTDRRNHKQLVDTTVEIANKVGGPDIIRRIVDDLKEENENYRKMVVECIEKILVNLGASDIDARVEEQLIDGILYAYQVFRYLFIGCWNHLSDTLYLGTIRCINFHESFFVIIGVSNLCLVLNTNLRIG